MCVLLGSYIYHAISFTVSTLIKNIVSVMTFMLSKKRENFLQLSLLGFTEHFSHDKHPNQHLKTQPPNQKLAL